MAKGSRGKPQRQPENKAVDKDGNVNPEKLKTNQEQLRVDEKHQTPDMRKQHRGTFP